MDELEIAPIVAQRDAIVAELVKLQAWITGDPSNPCRQNWSMRVGRLSQEAARLKRVIKDWNREHYAKKDRDRRMTLASRFYSAVADLEESGVDVGERLRAMLVEFESGDDTSASAHAATHVGNELPGQRLELVAGLDPQPIRSRKKVAHGGA